MRIRESMHLCSLVERTSAMVTRTTVNSAAHNLKPSVRDNFLDHDRGYISIRTIMKGGKREKKNKTVPMPLCL